MKGRLGETQDFRVPLSDEALRVIERAKENSKDGYLFPGKRQPTISLDSMAAIMRKRGLKRDHTASEHLLRHGCQRHSR